MSESYLKMAEIAERHRHEPEGKARRLIAWLREQMCPELPEPSRRRAGAPAQWNGRRVLSFNESREGT